MLGSSVAEQVTVNHLVAGSNPARAAIGRVDLINVQFGPNDKFPVQGPATNAHQFSSLGFVSLGLKQCIAQ